MIFGKNLRGAVVCLACWGLAAPQSFTVAQDTPAASQAQRSDVELAKGGVLRGKVVDAQGKPVANATVSLQFAGQVVARTSSNKNGSYAIKSLRGGVHRLVGGTDRDMVRLWSAGSAPTTASKTALSVTGSVVRGQYSAPGTMPMQQGYAPPMQQGYAPPMDQGYAPPMDQGYIPMDQGYAAPVGGEYYAGGGGGGAGFASGAGGSGFGMLDVITLATVGTSAAALVYALDNNDKLDDLEDALASP